MKHILVIFYLLASFDVIGQITHKLTFDEKYCLDIVTYENGHKYTTIKMPQTDNLLKEGMPVLPTKTEKFLIPEGASNPWIEIINLETEKFNIDHPLLPGNNPIPIGQKQEIPKMYIEFNPENNTEMIYPANTINFEGVGKMREFNIANISIFPFQYYAVQKKLVFIKEVEFILHYQCKNKTLSVKQFNDKNKVIQETVCSYIANKNDFLKFYHATTNTYRSDLKADNSQLEITKTGIALNCDYVIVTTDNYLPALSEFTAWKRRKGINIEVVGIDQVLSSYSGDIVSGIIDSAGKLRQFLHDVYSNSPCFQYALFIDDGNIPIRYLNHDSDETDPEMIYPADYYFADFDIDWEKDGDNNHGESEDSIWFYEPDIFVGRLLVKNTDELRNWIRKVKLYETDPGKGNRDYLTKAYFTDADRLHSDIITDELTWCNTVKVHSEQGGYNTPNNTPSFPTGNDVINEFNNLYGVAGFCAHGNPTSVATATKGMNINDPLSKYGVTSLDAYNNTSNSGCCLIPENGNGFDNMTNKDHPTIFLSISCQTMPFDDFGHSPSIRNMGESYTVISEGGGPVYIGNTRNGFCASTNTVLGKMMSLSNENTFYNLGKLMGIAKESNHGIVSYVKYSLSLLGCPETELWTATPTTYSSASVSESGTNVTVNTGGVTGSTICVMSALDNGESYYLVKSNVSSWTFTGVSKPYYVTITKHNKIPFIKNPTTVLIENKTFNSNAYISCQTLAAGYSVDPNHTPNGNVIIANGASVTFDATGNILLDHGFEVELGATFEAK